MATRQPTIVFCKVEVRIACHLALAMRPTTTQLALLLLAWCSVLGASGLESHAQLGLPLGGTTTKGGYALPLHRKHQAPTRGRMLLRNSSYPLHGTVKDLGYGVGRGGKDRGRLHHGLQQPPCSSPQLLLCHNIPRLTPTAICGHCRHR